MVTRKTVGFLIFSLLFSFNVQNEIMSEDVFELGGMNAIAVPVVLYW